VLYGSAAGTIARLAKDANATRYLSNTGTSNNPAWAQVNLTNGVTGVLPSANGGVDTTAWSSYTPSLSPFSGTFTDVTATGKYKTIGKTTHVHIEITVTTNGTAAGYIAATLPNTANMPAAFYGRSNGGRQLQGIGASGLGFISIFAYDNTYPAASGELLYINGTYENI
jgi:hypothetical protein